MGIIHERYPFAMIILPALLLLCGCSTLPEVAPGTPPPMRTFEATVRGDKPQMLDVSDSMEGFNRGTYRFNYYFDEYFMRPVVRTYEFIMPDYAEDRVSRAVDNIGDVGNFTNNLLQLKFKAAGITLGRVLVNSTAGVAGLWDPASKWGLERHPEDFGQTLGHYGAGNGSYIVLPILGPSNVRDTAGLVAGTAAFNLVGPAAWVNDSTITTAYTATSSVDKRHRIPFRYRQTGSPFEYDLLRMLYTMQRELEIEN